MSATLRVSGVLFIVLALVIGFAFPTNSLAIIAMLISGFTGGIFWELANIIKK